MTEADLKRLKQWFASYVGRYLGGDADLRKNTELKALHTMNVCRETRLIGRGIKLPADLLVLSEAAALLHDIGRFEQYARYRTFSDQASENHAALGLRIIASEEVLEGVDADARDLLGRVISYHNQPELPEADTDHCLLLTRLLRDADKLDIWRVVIEYYRDERGDRNDAIAVGLGDTPGVSPAVVQRLLDRQPVRSRDVRNLNDFKLFQIGWVYDLNFPPTFRAARDRRTIEIIYTTIPSSPEVDRVFALATSYLERKASEDGSGGPVR